MSLKQSTSPRLLGARRTREHAAFWRRVICDGSAVPQRLRFRASRWRNGTAPSPTEDLDEIMSRIGPVEAALIVERVVGSYELWHGEADPRELDALMDAEQAAEGRETRVQIRASREPAALGLWIEEAEAELAVQRRAIAAARARLYGVEKAA